MLPLEDRIRVALGAGMGIQLQSGEVETVARMLVALRKIDEEPTANIRQAKTLAHEALVPFNR